MKLSRWQKVFICASIAWVVCGYAFIYERDSRLEDFVRFLMPLYILWSLVWVFSWEKISNLVLWPINKVREVNRKNKFNSVFFIFLLLVGFAYLANENDNQEIERAMADERYIDAMTAQINRDLE